MRIRVVIVSLLALVAGPRLASAQIVNVQSVLATEADQGLSGSVRGSIDYRTGNIDVLRLSALATTTYRQEDHHLIAILKGDFGKASGDRYIARTFEHLRYRNQLTDRFIVEGFLQHEYDQFRRLELRALAGLGGAVRLLRGKRYNLSVGVAYMPEYERLRDDEQSDAGQDSFFHRTSSYANGAIELDKRIQFVQTVYAQPRINKPSDARYLSESQFVVQLTEHLTQTTSFSIAYDTRPPEAIEKRDTALKSTLIYSF